MKAIVYLLKRYLLPHEGSLLSFALWVSVVGVALGIVQLMVVLSVMSGFQGFLKESYTRITSEMVAIPMHSSDQDESFAKNLAAIQGIEAITPFTFGQAMILKNGVGGVTLEGIELASSSKVTDWNKVWVEPPLDQKVPDSHWIWLGAQLAEKLRIHRGDTVNVFIPGERKRIFPFVVTAITKFGIYDHDMRYAYLSLDVLRDLFQPESLQTLYKCALGKGVDLDKEVDLVESTLQGRVRVKRWSEINQNLFRAVQHQKWMLFAILEIVIGLAAMNVVNLLMMSSHHRRRDIAILRAMGMKFREVVLFFVAQGTAVGMVGIACGIGLGYLACLFIERFQPTLLSEKIYNVSRLPVTVRVGDVLWICVWAFLVCVVFSVLPALKAAWARPVVALRQDN